MPYSCMRKPWSFLFRIPLLLVLLFLVLAPLLLPGCGGSRQEGGEAGLKKWFALQQDTLQQELALLDSQVRSQKPLALLQKQFAVASTLR